MYGTVGIINKFQAEILLSIVTTLIKIVFYLNLQWNKHHPKMAKILTTYVFLL